MNRRRLLALSTSAMAAVAAYFASIPFVRSFLPSAKALALGNPVAVDLSRLAPGQVGAYLYRGRTILVLRRTEAMLDTLPALAERVLDPDTSADPAYVDPLYRSINPEFLVVDGVCTHLGCVPQKLEEQGTKLVGDWWTGGFICPCHASAYDYAGRVIRGPAPRNLPIPPHRYSSSTTIIIGEPSASLPRAS
jgi:ubiquinol-cytochrome c reductase iron-sulfur subunit